MNDKSTNQQKARLDSEELLVTSSTSSPSNLIDTRASTLTTTPSSSPTSTTSTRILIGGRSTSGCTSAIATGGGLRGGSSSLCPVVTSSTGGSSSSNTASNIVTINLDDDDEDDEGSSECLVGVDDPNQAGTSDDSSSSRYRNPTAGSSRQADMVGLPSQNDGETCVVISTTGSGTSSSTAGCSEHLTDTSRRNMLLTMRSSDANNAAEGNSNAAAVSVPSTPTTRSKRKLQNSDNTGSTESGGSSTTTATSTHGVSRSSINLNYNKTLDVDVQNHQDATVKKRTNATATGTLSSSISNSTSCEQQPPGKAPKGGKNMDTMKNCNEDTIAEEDEEQSGNGQEEAAESHHHQNERTDDGTATDNRKVEPIKINLSRDVVKSKITIKASVAKESSSDHLVVPKLTIKSMPALSDSSSSSALSFNDSEERSTHNCTNDPSSDVREEIAQQQVVPKLIIRASDCSNTTVPKLTIKMDNSVNCVSESNENESSSLSPSPSSSPSSGAEQQTPPSSQPPLPKLTIKTSGDTAESIISSSFSSTATSSVLLSPPIGSSAQPTVPKLTIKNISKSSAATATVINDGATVPKLTIRTTGCVGGSASQSSPTASQLANNTDTGTSSQDDSSRTNSPIPKFTIKTVPSQDTNSSTPSVPRLKICTKQQPDVTSETSDVVLSPTIPKFTIKTVQERDQSIPKLTISVNDRLASTESVESVSKVTPVKRSEPQDSVEKVPKLTISSIQESPKVKPNSSSDRESTIADKPEKLPKLTIKTTPVESECQGEVHAEKTVPKLTIKTTQPESDLQGDVHVEKTVPKLTIKTVCTEEVDAGEKPERVPKITIKTVSAESSPDIDKVPKLMIKTVSTASEPSPETSVERIPKLTIKTVATPTETSSEVGAEKVPKLTIKTVASPTDPGSEAGTEKIPKLMIKTVSTPAETVEAETVPKLTIKTAKIADATDSASCDKVEKVPKITIKTVTESPDTEKVPKLTIKPIPEPQTIVVANMSTQNADPCPDEAEKVPEKAIPKLTIKPIVEPETNERLGSVLSTVSSPLSPSGRVPKITIKPVPEVKTTIDLTEDDQPQEAIPKLKIKSHSVVSQLESTSADKIPKLTIRTKSNALPPDNSEPAEKKPKLVVHQSAEESDNRIRKLTIKPIPNNVEDESSATATATASSLSPSPKVPKLTINNHTTPGKHLKRAGRRKKGAGVGEIIAGDGGESASNDSVEVQLVPNSNEPAAVVETAENPITKTRSSARIADNSKLSETAPTTQKTNTVQSKNGPVPAADVKDDKQSAVKDTAMLPSSILAEAAVVDPAVETIENAADALLSGQTEVSEKVDSKSTASVPESRFDLVNIVNSTEASSTETMETDLSGSTDVNLELELERITSQSKDESNSIVRIADTVRNNLRISVDISDAAINDLVDILNDDDLDDIATLGNDDDSEEKVEKNSTAPMPPPKNKIDETKQEKTQVADDNNQEQPTVLPNCVEKPTIKETPEQQPTTPPVVVVVVEEKPKPEEKKTEEKSPAYNSDEVVSLGSDEDDIVDQLTELLTEAAESSDVVRPRANGDASSEAKVEKPCMDEPKIVASPKIRVEEVKDPLEVSTPQESSNEITETPIEHIEVPEVTNTVKNGSLAVSNESSLSNLSDCAIVETIPNCNEVPPEQSILPEPVFLKEKRLPKIMAANQDPPSVKEPETKPIDKKKPPPPRTRSLRDAPPAVVVDPAPAPVINEINEREKSPVETRSERPTRGRPKRNAVDEKPPITPVPTKRTRSEKSKNSTIVVSDTPLLKSSSHMSVDVESCINSSIVARVLKDKKNSRTTTIEKSPLPIKPLTSSDVVEIDSSSASNETFQTLTELKPLNSVKNTVSSENATDKQNHEESSHSTLRGILTRLRPQDSHEEPPVVSKRLEPEIAVIRSASPPKNSLKTTQSVMLMNDDTDSDCVMYDEDPLMIGGGVDSDLEGEMKRHHEEVVEDEYITPAKRPRGRPRKDGKPAGSVVRRGRRTMEAVSTRNRPQSSLLDGAQPATLPESKKSPVIDKEKAMVLNHIFQEPEPAIRTPLKDSPIKFEPPSAAEITTPVTPPRRGRGRGRGSRGGGSSIIQNASLMDEETDNENLDSIVRSRGRGRGGSSVYRSRSRGRGRGSRGARGRGFARRLLSPEKNRDGEFFTPKRPSLQVFEEDTRMSADLMTPMHRQLNDSLLNNNDENTQSSMLSTSSALDGSSNTTILNPVTGEREKKKRSKMEVTAPEGKTEYTVDMICEYDWPPPKGCCPARNRDSFMIQEQIAQYLGIKSFKRKYPDLPRRQIDMEERNYLQEKGLVTEKMCDLGITAVWASDVLDIMYSDFYEKFEEYKAYLREKQVRDVEAKQRTQAVDKGVQARDRALESAKMWNSTFNKARLDERRSCLDLQNLVIQLPAAVGQKLSRPTETVYRQPSHYPIALVPGQFSENYRSYTAEELRKYPINTILEPFDDRLSHLYKRPVSDDEVSVKSENESSGSSSGSDSDSESSSDSDSDSDSSSDEEEGVGVDVDKPPDENKFKCFICHQPANKNQRGFPELFIQCVTCRKQIHPSCIEMSGRMQMRVRNYNWQCADCKCCIKCKRKQDESKMLYCEQCDRGYHIYCIQIKHVPDGRWSCERCAVCMRCGSTKPEGNLPPPPLQPNQKAARKRGVKWVNDYRLDPVTKIREHYSIVCLPCSRSRNKTKTSPVPLASPTSPASPASSTSASTTTSTTTTSTATVTTATKTTSK